MPTYMPVLRNEIDARYLQRQVEGVTTGRCTTPFTRRLAELDRECKEAGNWATFGAEVEFQFSINPEAEDVAESNGIVDDDDLIDKREHLFRTIFEEMTHSEVRFIPGHPKGSVYYPHLFSSPIAVTSEDYWDNYGQHESILEIQTTPAGPAEARLRYWSLITAIGRVAGKLGLQANLMATHVSTAIMQGNARRSRSAKFIDMREPEAKLYIAGAQAMLTSLQVLQIDAGLERGVCALEAFPDKNASTTVHDKRLELRHSLVGVADPRIDILSVLQGIRLAQEGKVPEAAIRAAHSCSLSQWKDTGMLSPRMRGITDVTPFLNKIWVEDRTGDVVTTVDHSMSADAGSYASQLRTFAKELSGRDDIDPYANGGAWLRSVTQGLKIVEGKLSVPDAHPYKRELLDAFEEYAVCGKADSSHLVRPHLIFDSPEIHYDRRKNIKKSSLVRQAFGSALASVIGADESIKRRQRLVDAQMIVFDRSEEGE